MADDAHTPVVANPRFGSVRRLFKGWGLLMGVGSAASAVGGATEAGVLVLVAQGAFALAGEGDGVEILAGLDVSVGDALLFAGVLLVVRIAAGASSAWATARVAAGVVARSRSELVAAYLDADFATVHARASGRLQELLTTFGRELSALVFHVGKIATAGVTLAALIVVAAIVNPVAALVALGAYGLQTAIMSPLRTAVRRLGRVHADRELELGSQVAEISRLDIEARVFGVESSLRRRLDEITHATARVHRRLRFSWELTPVVSYTVLYATVIGALAVVRLANPPNLASAGAVLLILLRSSGYAQGIHHSLAVSKSSLSFVEELDREVSLYRSNRRPSGGESLDALPSISMEAVSFEYVPGTPVLDDVSVRFGPKEIVGVVGSSGAGKTTLVHLLLGLRRPSGGSVLVAGRDISAVDRGDWSRLVGFVPQQPSLFMGSVAENIRFFRNWISDDAVEQAARLANIHDEIATWPGGYDHEVGPRGGSLSIGQQQRITIARVLAGEAELLVLDEPTSALDHRNDALIRRTLEGLRGSMTIVIVAHRVSTLEICDRIVVVEDGRVRQVDAALGSPADAGFDWEALGLLAPE